MTFENTHLPPSSAEAAAAELVRLYVQKGHNHHACHRFLKKRRSRRLVCVHPWTKGFVQPIHLPLVPPPIHKQGRVTLFSYHTQRSCGEEWEGKLGQFPVPATQLLIKPFHFLLFVSWCFMLPPPNSFFSATFSSRAFYSLSPQSRETTIVQTPTISRTFRHAVPPPSFPSW